MDQDGDDLALDAFVPICPECGEEMAPRATAGPHSISIRDGIRSVLVPADWACINEGCPTGSTELASAADPTDGAKFAKEL